MTTLARHIDTITSVPDEGTRDDLFPNPQDGQKVLRRDTSILEEYQAATGTWVTMLVGLGATPSFTGLTTVTVAGLTLRLNNTAAAGLNSILDARRGSTTRWQLGFNASDEGAILNAAANAANLSWTDAGAFTMRAGLTVAAGGLTVTAGTAALQALTATTGLFSSTGQFGGTLTVTTGGLVVTGNSTITGTLGGITTLTATTLGGTLSTAAQPNVTSVGTLTSLAVGAITSTGLFQTTLTTEQLRLRYDAGTYLSVTVASNGDVTFTNNAGGSFRLEDSGTVTMLTVVGFANGMSVASGTASLQAMTATTGAFSALLSANAGLTLASGQTLTLTGATVAGAPTWSSSQAITLSTAAQPSITSVGTLTSLAVGAITSTGLFQTTLTTEQLRLRYDASHFFTVTVESNHDVTLANSASASMRFEDSGTITMLVTTGFASGISVASGTTSLQAMTATTGVFSSTVSMTDLTAVAGTFTGKIQATLTTEQMRLRYDASNHLAITVQASGVPIFNPSGGGCTFLGYISTDSVMGLGLAGVSNSVYLNLPASDSGHACLRLAHGSAPSAPTNGDMWTTTAGLFVRINGATVGPLS